MKRIEIRMPVEEVHSFGALEELTRKNLAAVLSKALEVLLALEASKLTMKTRRTCMPRPTLPTMDMRWEVGVLDIIRHPHLRQ